MLPVRINITNILVKEAPSSCGDPSLKGVATFEVFREEGAVIYIVVIEWVGIIISPLYPLIITL